MLSSMPLSLRPLLRTDVEEMKAAAFLITRTGAHYKDKQRLKLFFDEGFSFDRVIQDEDDITSLYKLYGPYRDPHPDTFPSHKFIQINFKMGHIYYQEKTEVPYLI